MNPDSLDNAKTIDHRLDDGKGRGELSPGTMLGQYRIIRLLGRGGMGEVYEVEHEVLRRRYALKFIPDELVNQRGFLERFKREAQVTAHLDHPHIVKVDDFGETEEIFWLRMELVEGIEAEGQEVSTLAELAESGGGKVEQGLLARILNQMLEGLSYAHGKGTVHRDLKPANILLYQKTEDRGQKTEKEKQGLIGVKISDFGLVRLVGEEWVRSRAELSVSLSMSLGDKDTVAGRDKFGTSTHSLLGTYEYMSPEQKRGEDADARSDLYAVGLMAFRLLTGQKELGFKLPSQLSNEISPLWDEVVATALEPAKKERFSSAEEMLKSLGKVKKALDVILEEEQEREEEKQRQEEDKRREAEHKKQETLRREEEKRRQAAEERRKEEERRRQEADQLRLEEKRRQREAEELRKKAEALRIEEEKTPEEMVLIPAGEFLMGSNEGRDEKPMHEVYVDAFYMDKYEVTVAQFRKFVEETGYRTDAEKKGWAYAWTGRWKKKKGASWKNPGFRQTDNHPVVDVSWNDAVAYAKWAGKRLPSEAEWEKAARGGLEGKKYPWGDSIDSSKANYEAKGYLLDVGSYPPNGYGLYDMAGNVWEWVADRYDSGYYKKSPYKNPQGPGRGKYRVLRGGSWDDYANYVRAAIRDWFDPVSRYDGIGFRCALRAGGQDSVTLSSFTLLSASSAREML